ncbi:MAG TPA: dihydroorotate dehydrogenase [bacterium]|nr:dihydroorotate dehydrogenase [bacterium]
MTAAHPPLRDAATTAPQAAPRLAVMLAGVVFPTPVLAAPGTLGFGREVRGTVDLRAFGGFITKSLTAEPRGGHARPQIVEVAGGWLNAVGLANPGLTAFLTRDLPYLRTLSIPIVVSLAGASVEEFRLMAQVLDEEDGIAAIEVNVSCPNVAEGMLFGTDPALTAELVRALRGATGRPLFVKLTPNVTSIAAIARAAVDAGADALCCINTLAGLAIDPESWRPRLGGGMGGLSGPAIRPVAVRMVWEVARAVPVPVIGAGGVGNAADALEFFLAGARAVAVASAVISDPAAAERITEGLSAYLSAHGIADINDIVGKVEGLD